MSRSGGRRVNTAATNKPGAPNLKQTADDADQNERFAIGQFEVCIQDLIRRVKQGDATGQPLESDVFEFNGVLLTEL